MNARLLAVSMVLFATSCSHSRPDVDSLIAAGDVAHVDMERATLRREYWIIFDNYEILRQNYIELAESIDKVGVKKQDRIMERLTAWEPMIQSARLLWNSLDDEPAIVDQWASSPEFTQLLEESRMAYQKRNEEWAPIEARLDLAIEKIGDLRAIIKE